MLKKKIFKKNFLVFLFLFFLAFSFSSLKIKAVSAQAVNDQVVWGNIVDDSQDGNLKDAINNTGLGKSDPRLIATRIISIFLGMLGLIAVCLIIYAGFLWMTAAGDEDKVEKARTLLKNAVIGLAIILASYGIAYFILNVLLKATGGGGSGNGGLNDVNDGAGIGTLGNGIVKSVYPSPNQREVPRNTAIIVTFREPMDPSTICSNVVSGKCANGAEIKQDSIKIYKFVDNYKDNNSLLNAYVSSNDNTTFVFNPKENLGSSSEYIWYAVRLTDGIKKANKEKAFNLSDSFWWKFEVSSKLDLTSPKILSIFPGADNAKDNYNTSSPAEQASSKITIKALPNVSRSASISFVNNINQAIKNVTGINQCLDGTVNLVFGNNGSPTVNINYNQPGLVNTSDLPIIDNRIDLTPCGLTVILNQDNYPAGSSSDITLISRVNADTLTIGDQKYTFVASNQGNVTNKEIRIDQNINTIAANIANALSGNDEVVADVSGNVINIKAKNAGEDGNKIFIGSTNSNALNIIKMSGGKDVEKSVTPLGGAKDKPMNTVIQINFNEAINPLTAAGTSFDLQNYLKVVNVADGSIVSGNFIISNQYKTIEFISDNKCGVNGCGEDVYCLPANSNLRVDVRAANLKACSGNDDCKIFTPFNFCNTGFCTKENENDNRYPSGDMASGIADLASNSLDGNKNDKTFGPIDYYNENVKDITKSDNYQWSFFINDQIDLTPPRIKSNSVLSCASGVNKEDAISINFNKPMLSSSLTTGSTVIESNKESVIHKFINILGDSKGMVGYWVDKQDVILHPDLTNEPDETIALAKHAAFKDLTAYKIQVGSGVKDIYQNCFKPCNGSNCSNLVDATNSSCCGSSPSNKLNKDGNCENTNCNNTVGAGLLCNGVIMTPGQVCSSKGPCDTMCQQDGKICGPSRCNGFSCGPDMKITDSIRYYCVNGQYKDCHNNNASECNDKMPSSTCSADRLVSHRFINAVCDSNGSCSWTPKDDNCSASQPCLPATGRCCSSDVTINKDSVCSGKCGIISVQNACGVMVSVDCGGCASGVCQSNNTCAECLAGQVGERDCSPAPAGCTIVGKERRTCKSDNTWGDWGACTITPQCTGKCGGDNLCGGTCPNTCLNNGFCKADNVTCGCTPGATSNASCEINTVTCQRSGTKTITCNSTGDLVDGECVVCTDSNISVCQGTECCKMNNDINIDCAANFCLGSLCSGGILFQKSPMLVVSLPSSSYTMLNTNPLLYAKMVFISRQISGV